ncbi:DUF3574 domain-containing protein [Tahibacter harae]|uniref:DUF3574 domain-containing protein n=1 Tax=Tahibacter harae TaxID=2963937 RepID=A0ABT1QS03_9GAMM|nr:DUF3574 domain-containing protein [Tahibacter harae]MCQ4165064.1 DUF3574 domain-containing protein [Tahibacter harae]
MNLPRPAALAFAALSLTACATAPHLSCAPAQQALIADELFFGTAMPQGQVTPEQWQAFLSEEVTPRFPQGLSVVSAAGQWRGNDGSLVHESSYVLTLVHPDDAASEASILAIAQAYKTRFRQEAVMRLKQRACTSF